MCLSRNRASKNSGFEYIGSERNGINSIHRIFYLAEYMASLRRLVKVIEQSFESTRPTLAYMQKR